MHEYSNFASNYKQLMTALQFAIAHSLFLFSLEDILKIARIPPFLGIFLVKQVKALKLSRRNCVRTLVVLILEVHFNIYK